jgi:hypothetical protein
MFARRWLQLLAAADPEKARRAAADIVVNVVGEV